MTTNDTRRRDDTLFKELVRRFVHEALADAAGQPLPPDPATEENADIQRILDTLRSPWIDDNEPERSGGVIGRDYFAAHAPVGMNEAVQCYGSHPNLKSDSERAAFMAAWSFLRYEYADAMLAQRSEGS